VFKEVAVEQYRYYRQQICEASERIAVLMNLHWHLSFYITTLQKHPTLLFSK